MINYVGDFKLDDEEIKPSATLLQDPLGSLPDKFTICSAISSPVFYAPSSFFVLRGENGEFYFAIRRLIQESGQLIHNHNYKYFLKVEIAWLIFRDWILQFLKAAFILWLTFKFGKPSPNLSHSTLKRYRSKIISHLDPIIRLFHTSKYLITIHSQYTRGLYSDIKS